MTSLGSRSYQLQLALKLTFQKTGTGGCAPIMGVSRCSASRESLCQGVGTVDQLITLSRLFRGHMSSSFSQSWNDNHITPEFRVMWLLWLVLVNSGYWTASGLSLITDLVYYFYRSQGAARERRRQVLGL